MRIFLATTLAVLTALPAAGAEAWFVRFSTHAGSCDCIAWSDSITLHNSTNLPKTVRLLDVSDGPILPGIDPNLTLAPHQTRMKWSLDLDDWRPAGGARFWVAHLDVPEGVISSSHAEINRIGPSVNPSGAYVGRQGAVPLRVVRRLTPANVPQIHLRTDIGFTNESSTARVIPARINVGIYNAGSAEGTAVVEVRRACDGSLVESRFVQLPPNSIRQFAGFSSAAPVAGTCTTGGVGYETYVVVTLNQPGFSYAVALSNENPPFIPVTAGVGD